MYKWLKNARHSILRINSNLFKMKGLDFVKLLAFDDYQASDGWLGRLRKCFNVSFKTVSGKYTFAMSLEFVPSFLSHLLDWKLYQRIPTSKRYCQRLVKNKKRSWQISRCCCCCFFDRCYLQLLLFHYFCGVIVISTLFRGNFSCLKPR